MYIEGGLVFQKRGHTLGHTHIHTPQTSADTNIYMYTRNYHVIVPKAYICMQAHTHTHVFTPNTLNTVANSVTSTTLHFNPI